MNLFELLLPYLARVAPGMLVLAAAAAALRPGKAVRAVFYIAAFVLLRDAMTPLGLWRLGSSGGALWIRLIESHSFLIAFGLASLGMSAALFFLDRENAAGIRLFDGSPLRGAALGALGAALAAGPLIALYRFVPIASRGGPVAPSLLPSIAAFAFLGNLFEELLFRGYLASALEPRFGRMGAGLRSGLVFAACHVYLATTVTGVGWPLLAFTAWEGLVAGFVGARRGLVPAALAHGGAILLLSSGLV